MNLGSKAEAQVAPSTSRPQSNTVVRVASYDGQTPVPGLSPLMSSPPQSTPKNRTWAVVLRRQ